MPVLRVGEPLFEEILDAGGHVPWSLKPHVLHGVAESGRVVHPEEEVILATGFVYLGYGELEGVGEPTLEVPLDALVVKPAHDAHFVEALLEMLLTDAPQSLVGRRWGFVLQLL